MILGECPHCGAPTAVPLADGRLPAWSEETCPTCGAGYWQLHSRLEPRCQVAQPAGLRRRAEPEA